MSQAGKLINGFVPPPPGTFVDTLTGNSGGAVGPDGSDNINVIGDGTTIDVTGNPGTNTLTISAIGSSGISTIDGDTGSVTGSTVTIFTNKASSNANGTLNFSGSGTVMTLNVNDAFSNIGVGTACFKNASPGNFNVALGNNALQSTTAAATNNVGIGQGALNILTTGFGNISIGSGTGTIITTESGNILLNDTGVGGTSNSLRIGTALYGTQSLTSCFIGGIDGVDVGSTATVVTESGDQLGTAVITAGSGISVTPGANTITIATTAAAPSSVIGTARGTLNTTSNDNYVALFTPTPQLTAALVGTPIPFNATISNLYVNAFTNASTINTTVTLNVNGSDTALVATNTALTTGVASDTTHSVNVTAGDLICFHGSTSSTGTVVGIATCKIVPT